MDYLIEKLKTARNLIETAIILHEYGKDELLPTQIEFLYLEVQNLIDNYCVKSDIIEDSN